MASVAHSFVVEIYPEAPRPCDTGEIQGKEQAYRVTKSRRYVICRVQYQCNSVPVRLGLRELLLLDLHCD